VIIRVDSEPEIAIDVSDCGEIGISEHEIGGRQVLYQARTA
jgi:hypothetical protein